MLMINDAEKPVAVAGVMGGLNSEIEPDHENDRDRIRELRGQQRQNDIQETGDCGPRLPDGMKRASIRTSAKERRTESAD